MTLSRLCHANHDVIFMLLHTHRCFYDLDCKPQTEDLVSPNCGNAAPLPNPWQSGKCCFYDSQCKPQCEDKTNSKCKALSIPACSVTGCGWCSATNPAVCERCWTGYTLNLVTSKCDCAPGYYGSTSCKKCAAGSVSYGGQLPTASCTPCPPGRVANKEQAECVLATSWDHWGYGEWFLSAWIADRTGANLKFCTLGAHRHLSTLLTTLLFCSLGVPPCRPDKQALGLW